MPQFETTPPIPYVPISEKATEVRSAIDAARLSNDNSFGGLQKLAIPGPFATDAEASTNGVPDDNLYYRSDGTVRAASHLSLDLAFALDKTLTARVGPTPMFTRSQTSATGSTYVGADKLIKYADNNEARFDHDPITGVCKGLLIEEQRTNAVQHSANFKNTTSSNYWENTSATTVTVDQIASPDGGVNADLLTTSATSFDCFFRRLSSWAGSTQYTYSIFLKQGPSNHRYVGLYIGAGTGLTQFPFFDFNNPTVVQIPSGTMVGTINSTQVDAYPNGWYRVIVTFTTSATPVNTSCGSYISTSNGTLPGSSAAGLDAYVWGIQSELGSFASSYIPTTTAPLIRSADVCSYTDVSSFYNPAAGTLVGDLILYTPPPSGIPELFRFGSGNNRIQFGVTNVVSEAIRPFIINGGTETYSTKQGTTVAGTSRKVAITFATNDAISCLNGTLGVQDTSVTMPVSISTAFIGASSFTGHIASIRYYKKRLTNFKLQSLTS